MHKSILKEKNIRSVVDLNQKKFGHPWCVGTSINNNSVPCCSGARKKSTQRVQNQTYVVHGQSHVYIIIQWFFRSLKKSRWVQWHPRPLSAGAPVDIAKRPDCIPICCAPIEIVVLGTCSCLKIILLLYPNIVPIIIL